MKETSRRAMVGSKTPRTTTEGSGGEGPAKMALRCSCAFRIVGEEGANSA
jgi:hypothetical protein